MMPVLRAEAPVYGGYVISRDDGIVFIKGAVPGEVVEVSVREKKRDYSVASVSSVIEPSSFRVSARCPHFGLCGGCQLQYISYEKQLAMKEEVLLDCLKRIGGEEARLEPALRGRDFNYRRRGQFKVSREGLIGFYREGTRDVVDINECPLMTAEINGVLEKVRALGPAGIKEIHITHGDSVLALVKGRGFDEGLAGRLIEIGLSGVAFDDGSYRGTGYVGFDLLGMAYTVCFWSFFQCNWDLNRAMVGLITEGLEPLEGKRVLDMYAGAGNFALPLSRAASEVIAVEENPHAIRDGQRNVSANGIGNVRFVRAPAEKAKVAGGVDYAVLDPPRPGLSGEAIKKLLDINPEKIVYVACNPATFARDVKKLREKYETGSVRLVDFFPHTYHIESVAFLTRKNPR